MPRAKSVVPPSDPGQPSDFTPATVYADHCILIVVWGEDDARVPALVLYA